VKKNQSIAAFLAASLLTSRKAGRRDPTGKNVRRNIVLWIRAITHSRHATGNFFRGPVNPGKAVAPERQPAIIITP
jgi:hypothetical protein